MSTPKEKNRPDAADWLAAMSRWYPLAGVALIALAAFLIYLPSLNGGFILDDDQLLTENALIKAPDGLFRCWYTTNQPDYVPLTSSTLWVEWRLWGMNPTGYRITNLALHIAACLLIWVLLRRLSIPGAFLAALLFAVHPVNVESVAWIQQRKNTVSLVLFLLSLLWYLRNEEDPAAQPLALSGWNALRSAGCWYWLSLLAFALAMLSKGSVAVLPLVLLLVVWWQRGRITKADLFRTAPFFLIAAVLTPVIIWFVSHGFGEVVRQVTFVQRLLGSGAVVWFYLSKALLPIHLTFVYPQWNIQAANPLWWILLAAAVLVTAILWWQRGRPVCRALLFAWLFYILALLPVLGFTDSGYSKFSLVADHYQYIALIGVTALVAAGWSVWHQRLAGASRAAATGAAIAVSCLLAFLAERQSRLYTDAITLYQATLESNPDSGMVHDNLGVELREAGHLKEAIEQFQQSLRLAPNYAEAHTNLGLALQESGQIPEAIEQYEQALQLKPNFAEVHYNIGSALLRTGRTQQAIEHYEQATTLNPDFAKAYYALADALAKTDEWQKAIEYYQQALRLKLDNADIHRNLGIVLARVGRQQEAITQYQLALQQKPDDVDSHVNLGIALLNFNQPQEAIEYFQQSLRLKPDIAEAHYNLGNALLKSDRKEEALQHYRRALDLKPDYAEAYNGLGAGLLATSRPEDAVKYFQNAVRLKPDYVQTYANLAHAYAQLNRSAEAIETAQKAIELARSTGQTNLAQRMDAWLTNYRQSHPHSQDSPSPADVVPPSTAQ